MIIKYVGKGIDITQGMKETTSAKLNILSTYLGESDKVTVTYELENTDLTVTINFDYQEKPEVIKKTAPADNFYSLINKISDVIKANMSKLHGKKADIEKIKGHEYVEQVKKASVEELEDEE